MGKGEVASMKVLAVVADKREYEVIRRLLAQAGYRDSQVWLVNGEGFKSKPSMKQLRELKPVLDKYVDEFGPFDYIIAAGETASRLVLDESNVNINKLRGRDFEYAYGVKTPGKKAKECKSELPTE